MPGGAWKATEPSASIGTVPRMRFTPSDCTTETTGPGGRCRPLVPVGVGLGVDVQHAQIPGLAAQLLRRTFVDVAAEDHARLRASAGLAPSARRRGRPAPAAWSAGARAWRGRCCGSLRRSVRGCRPRPSGRARTCRRARPRRGSPARSADRRVVGRVVAAGVIVGRLDRDRPARCPHSGHGTSAVTLVRPSGKLKPRSGSMIPTEPVNQL